MTKSWAEALGVVIPKEEPPAPPPPAWGGAMTAPTFSELAQDEKETMPFEFAIQEALRALDVAAPAKEMKKRCVDVVSLLVKGAERVYSLLALHRSGLVNQGNTCFQNVILQSLLACAPFLKCVVQICCCCYY